MYKVPLQTSIQSGANDIRTPLPNDIKLPERGAIGVAIDGTPIFPNYNNRGEYAWTSCEADRCNAHAGGGADYHYHGDPFGPSCLYNINDYSGLSHPPLIGYAFDGFEIRGRYAIDGLDGVDIPLDECGGHSHDDLGYHYHAHTLQGLTTTSLGGVPGMSTEYDYTAYLIGPTTCWRGNIDDISNFWEDDRDQANYDRGRLTDSQSLWTDQEQLRPCCESTAFYVEEQDGIVLDGAATAKRKWCFPGSATVEVRNKGIVNMNDLKIGDFVRVGGSDKSPLFDRVFSFGHRDTDVKGIFLRMLLTGNHQLEVSPSHLILVQSSDSEKPRMSPASTVQLGDRLVLVSGETATVKKVEKLTLRGAFAPLTYSGSLGVDNVVASNYVTLQENSGDFLIEQVSSGVSMHWLAHLSQAPHRLICRHLSFSFFCEQETYRDLDGISHWNTWFIAFADWLLRQNGVFQVLCLVPPIGAFLVVAFAEFILTSAWSSSILCSFTLCLLLETARFIKNSKKG